MVGSSSAFPNMHAWVIHVQHASTSWASSISGTTSTLSDQVRWLTRGPTHSHKRTVILLYALEVCRHKRWVHLIFKISNVRITSHAVDQRHRFFGTKIFSSETPITVLWTSFMRTHTDPSANTTINFAWTGSKLLSLCPAWPRRNWFSVVSAAWSGLVLGTLGLAKGHTYYECMGITNT